MYSPHIPKERSYSCLLQLSNIMPLTVTSAPYVQYSFSETCSYVSKCPAGISYLRIMVYYTLHQTSAALQNVVSTVTKFPPHKYCCMRQLITSAWHTLPTFMTIKVYRYKYVFIQVRSAADWKKAVPNDSYSRILIQKQNVIIKYMPPKA